MARPSSVEEYLEALPKDARAALEKLRKTIRAAAPMATERISYGVPPFKHHGALVSYAAFKDHCSFFPMSPKVMEAHAHALSPSTYPKARSDSRSTSPSRLPS
jgi:uncharacterized protein YdhG (YjbR/CyaY superfamily)